MKKKSVKLRDDDHINLCIQKCLEKCTLFEALITSPNILKAAADETRDQAEFLILVF